MATPPRSDDTPPVSGPRRAAPPGTRLDRFLGPRFWPTWFGLAFLRGVNHLPYRWQLWIGRRLGDLTRYLLRGRVHVVRVNLALCFPDWTEDRREALLRQHFQALGMGLIETAMSWWGSSARLLGLVRFEGLEHLEAALGEGRGVLLVTGHFTAMELAAHTLSLPVPFDAMYRPMKNGLMDAIVLRARLRRRRTTIFARDDIRTMLKCLKQNHAVWYGPDQDYGRQHSVFVPFFGVPAATVTTTARFARASGARVVPYIPRREPDGTYLVTVYPALEEFPGSDPTADARRINALLENAIMAAPEQYYWVHRRFKTRPEGEPHPY